MIEITHNQARRMIHARLSERSLPEEQWAALYAHLETCPECRAFRAGMETLERSARRALRARWDPVDGPAPETAAVVQAGNAMRRAWRSALQRAGIGLAVLILLAALALSGRSRAQSEPTPPPDQTPTPLPSPTATPRFRTDGSTLVVAYETRRDGNGEIYLLNAGADPVNLTSHPGEDHSPAWSPDGEWLAFLSNRTGKDEVYIMHVSGSRLTRVTNDPGIDWRGPISWSPSGADGPTLALTGMRNESGAAWVYLVPLGGAAPYSLGNTRGAVQAGFSPDGLLLAFSGETAWGRLAIHHMNSGQFSTIDRFEDDSSRDGMIVLPQAGFDWTPDGRELIYLVGDPDGARSELRRTNLLTPLDITMLGRPLRVLPLQGQPARSPSAQATRDQAALLTDQEEDGCWELVRKSVFNIENPRINSIICYDHIAGRAGWLADGSGLVAAGRNAGGERGLYLVRFRAPDRVTSDRLWADDSVSGAPVVRPSTGGALLEVDPQTAPRAAEVPPSQPPAGTRGLLTAITRGERTFIERVVFSGSEPFLLNQSIGENRCPVSAPDGSRIAFLSDRDNAATQPGLPDIFVMDASGLNAVKLSRPEALWGTYTVTFGCPVWSPDGTQVAAVVRTASRRYLGIFPADPPAPSGPDEPSPNRYIPLPELLSYRAPLLWLPDGKLLVMMTYRVVSGGNAGLVEVDPNAPEDAALRPLIPHPDGLYTDAAGVALSPDGRRLAVLHTGARDAELRLYTREGEFLQRLMTFPEGVWSFGVPDVLRWVDQERLALTWRSPPEAPVKAAFYLLDTQVRGARLALLATTQDVLYGAAWSPDGRYLAYSTEGGLYLLDAHAAAEGATGPLRIGGTVTSEMGW